MVSNKFSYCQISLPIPCEESKCYGGWGREDSPYVGWHAQEHPSLRYQGWYISLWLLEKRLKSALLSQESGIGDLVEPVVWAYVDNIDRLGDFVR